MLARLAIGIPAAIGVIGFPALAVAASQGSGSGLDPDQRPWLVLIMAPVYFGWFVTLIGVFATWLFGSDALPNWLRSWISEDFKIASDGTVIERAARLSSRARLRLCLGVFGTGILFILGMFPWPLFVGWLFIRGDYWPIEAAAVAASSVAQAAVLVHIAFYIRSARTTARQ